MAENKKNIYPHPFAYNEEEQRAYTSFYTQRKASYIEPAETVYQGNAMMAFRDNYEAPTPNIAHIDGYKSRKEINE